MPRHRAKWHGFAHEFKNLVFLIQLFMGKTASFTQSLIVALFIVASFPRRTSAVRPDTVKPGEPSRALLTTCFRRACHSSNGTHLTRARISTVSGDHDGYMPRPDSEAV